jgi:hypothetical protein
MAGRNRGRWFGMDAMEATWEKLGSGGWPAGPVGGRGGLAGWPGWAGAAAGRLARLGGRGGRPGASGPPGWIPAAPGAAGAGGAGGAGVAWPFPRQPPEPDRGPVRSRPATRAHREAPAAPLATIPIENNDWEKGIRSARPQQKLALTIRIAALTLGSKSCYF